MVQAEGGTKENNKFFSARVVDGWNSLDEEAMTAETIHVNGFKSHLEKLGYYM